ncbi:hypothetical protein YTPLAS18_13110 [Nitrospira sp.]|nr:hypothetical protein YTPLAS18_13110 [Nitrospira sp.]
MDEAEAGKAQFLELVKNLDPAVQVVIPTAASNSVYLISLTKGPNRRFISLPEDDILDLPQEADIQTKVRELVRNAISGL